MRELYSSGSEWEHKLGYSRAVKVGETLYISATSAAAPDGSTSGDLYEQTGLRLPESGVVRERTTGGPLIANGDEGPFENDSFDSFPAPEALP